MTEEYMPILFKKFGKTAFNDPELLKFNMPPALIDFILVNQAAKIFETPSGKQILPADRLWMEFKFEKTNVLFAVELRAASGYYYVHDFLKIKDGVLDSVEARFSVYEDGTYAISNKPDDYTGSDITWAYRTKTMVDIVMSGIAVLNRTGNTSSDFRILDSPQSHNKATPTSGDVLKIVNLSNVTDYSKILYNNYRKGHSGIKKRFYMVRGHDRIYKDGRTLWVKHHYRGNKDVGVIDVVYVFNSDAEQLKT